MRDRVNSSASFGLMAAAAIAALVGVSGTALAQNALGDGRGLERDLRVGGTGNTPRADFGAEVRRRNAIVTGNAPGGMSFRGSVGYRDVGEFTSGLGSDTIYAFRRDSLFSGLAGMGYRGTEALQYQFANSTGNAAVPGGSLLVSRTGGGDTRPVSGYGATPQPAARGSLGGLPLPRTTPETSRTGTMRSTANFASNRSLTPVVIGYRRAGEGETPDTVAASSLLGIKTIPSAIPKSTRSPNAPPSAGAAPAGAAPASSAGERTPEGEPVANPLAAQKVRTSFDDYRERLGRFGEFTKEEPELGKAGDRAAGDGRGDGRGDGSGGVKGEGGDKGEGRRDNLDLSKGADGSKAGENPLGSPGPGDDRGAGGGDRGRTRLPEWQRRLDALKASLRPDGGQREATKTLESPEDDEPESVLAKGNKARRDAELKVRAERRQRLDRETVAMIRRAADEKTKTYIAAGDDNRDVFAEHVREGQRLLADERYFDAEERFSRALSLRPGDPASMAGRVNAQLGSGLYSSAALNVRTLLLEHPEAAGMRFESYLLPAPDRLAQLIRQLDSNITGQVELWKMPRESGLLMAYIGFQTGDKAALERGVSVFAENAPESEAGLVELVERVWLGRE